MLYLRAIVSIGVIITLAACAGLARQADTSGRFDGRWNGFVELTRDFQSYGHWEYKCVKFRNPLTLKIDNGQVAGVVRSRKINIHFDTVIDAGGRFGKLVKSEQVGRPFFIGGKLDAATGKGQGKLTLKWSGLPGGCAADWTASRSNA